MSYRISRDDMFSCTYETVDAYADEEGLERSGYKILGGKGLDTGETSVVRFILSEGSIHQIQSL